MTIAMRFGEARKMVREHLPDISNAERDVAVQQLVSGLSIVDTVASYNAYAADFSAALAAANQKKTEAAALLTKDGECRADVWAALDAAYFRGAGDTFDGEPDLAYLAIRLCPSARRSDTDFVAAIAKELANWFGCVADSMYD